MNAPSKTFLITGGAGFIGSALVAEAVRRGYHAVVLDKLTYAGHRMNLEWIEGDHTLVIGDIADATCVGGLFKKYDFVGVIHAAAESHVDNSIHGPRPFVDTNIAGTFELLECCRAYWQALPAAEKSAFRFLQISTDEVYGSLGATGKFDESSDRKSVV